MTTPTVFFVLVSLILGLYSTRRIRGSVRNYFVGGNTIPFWVLAVSLTGQAIELGGTQDNANFSMQGGFWAGAVLPVGIGLSLILLGLFFAKPLHALHLLTLPDFYARRYSQAIGLIVAMLCSFGFILLTAGNLAGLGILLARFLDLPPSLSVPVLGAVIMVYVIAGGLFAVTWNDVLQIGISCVAFALAFFWLVDSQDPELVRSTLSQSISFRELTDFEGGALKLWATLLALALGDIVALDFMERVFAAKSGEAARRGCITAGITTVAIGVALAAMGVIAAAVAQDPSLSFLDFVEQTFPPALRMLVVMGFLGAGLSTIDGALLACSVALSRNILQPLAPKLVSQDRLLAFSRVCAVPVTASAIILALVFPDPGELLVLSFDVVFAGCFVPLLLGIYWKAGTASAALWSIVIPSALRIAFHFVPELQFSGNLDGLQTLIPPLLSLLLFVGISVTAPRRAAGGAV